MGFLPNMDSNTAMSFYDPDLYFIVWWLIPVPHSSLFSLSSPLLSLFSLYVGEDTKWSTRVDVSLNPNTINLLFFMSTLHFWVGFGSISDWLTVITPGIHKLPDRDKLWGNHFVTVT